MDSFSISRQSPLHFMPADSCTLAQLAVLGLLQQRRRDFVPAAGECGCKNRHGFIRIRLEAVTAKDCQPA